jgi:hypothetical protein
MLNDHPTDTFSVLRAAGVRTLNVGDHEGAAILTELEFGFDGI